MRHRSLFRPEFAAVFAGMLRRFMVNQFVNGSMRHEGFEKDITAIASVVRSTSMTLPMDVFYCHHSTHRWTQAEVASYGPQPEHHMGASPDILNAQLRRYLQCLVEDAMHWRLRIATRLGTCYADFAGDAPHGSCLAGFHSKSLASQVGARLPAPLWHGQHAHWQTVRPYFAGQIHERRSLGILRSSWSRGGLANRL